MSLNRRTKLDSLILIEHERMDVQDQPTCLLISLKLKRGINTVSILFSNCQSEPKLVVFLLVINLNTTLDSSIYKDRERIWKVVIFLCNEKECLVHLSNYSHLSRKKEIKTHVKSFFKESSHDTIRINLASQSALSNRL